MNPFSRKLIFFIFVLAFALQSCTGIKNLVSEKSPKTATPASKTEKAASTKTKSKRQTSVSSMPKRQAPTDAAQPARPAPAPAINLAQRNIRAGNYQQAINIYSNECHRKPRDSQLLLTYAKSLDGIRSTADSAFAKREFADAGRIYSLLQRNYAKFSHVVQLISFDDSYLESRLSYCKKSLSLQGFQEYRAGRLDSALLSWQGVLDIDPNNRDIREAMKTAKRQKNNLSEDK